jgi:3-phenylpropionate/trans-cinnamate dioxygenase ferredoxin reductase component
LFHGGIAHLICSDILMNMHEYQTIFLGGGMVAGYAVKEFVERGLKPGELGIVSADNALPYERPPLSKSFLAGKDNEQSVLINPESFYREHGIGIHLNTEIDQVDIAGKQLLDHAGQAFRFGKLVFATGAHVRTLDVPGSNQDHVHYLRSMSDSARLRDALKSVSKVAVIGGGFIGMEVASQSAQQGRDTTMVLPEDRVWKSFFTQEMSQFFEKYYAERGVHFIHGAKIESIGRSSVLLSSGATLDADLVAVGIGVTPVTELAEKAGLQVQNGIVVSEFLETGSAGVYAAGDVANYQDVVFAKRRRVEHWDNAVTQGQYLARRLSGQPEPFRHIPYFFSDVFDLSYEFWGDTVDAERTEYRGDVHSPSFSAWWLKEKKVVAAFTLNRPDAERESASQLHLPLG